MKISESLAKEIDKLTWKYVNSHMKSVYLFDSIEDFHSELLCFVLGKMNKFDSNRAKLSTFVYCCCWTKCAGVFREFKRHGMCRVESLNDIIAGHDLSDEDMEFLDLVYNPETELDSNKLDLILLLDELSSHIEPELFDQICGASMKDLVSKFNVSRNTISRRLNTNRDYLRSLRFAIENDKPVPNKTRKKRHDGSTKRKISKLQSNFGVSERTAYRAIKKFNETGKCNSEEMKCILTED